MKHSNPDIIDHSKEDTLEALTGRTEGTVAFLKVHLVGLLEDINLNGGKYKTKNSYLLHRIMTIPNLTDEDKMVLVYMTALEMGESKGHELVCKHCLIGPGSEYLHNLMRGEQGISRSSDFDTDYSSDEE